MVKYSEISMLSGAKYYLFLADIQGELLNRQSMEYMLNGSDGVSILVRATNSPDGEKVYINPRMIESYKLFY